MVVMLFSPLYYFLIKKGREFYLLFLFAIYMSGIIPKIPGLSMVSIFYFNLGAYFSIYQHNFLVTFKKVEKYFYLISLILLFVTVYLYLSESNYYIYVRKAYIFASIVCFFNLSSYIITNSKWGKYKMSGDKVFFIYCCHTILLITILDTISCYYIAGLSPFILIPLYFCLPYIKITICIFLFLVLKKTVPSVLNVLVGCR